MNHTYVFRSRPHVTIQSPSALSVAGFSLIELMVAVAIVGILAAIAYPAYTSQMKKGRRSAAESLLMNIAQRQQQYLLDQRSYAPDVGTLNVTIPQEVTPYYTVAICQSSTPPCTAPAAGSLTYVAVATPIVGSAQAGDSILTIDNTGAKTPSSLW
jgi:type IV pilus assembly protein PilE